MEELCKKAVASLASRGFDAVYCDTADEAAIAVRSEIDAARRVGMGGSETMKNLGVTEYAQASGKLLTRGADCDLFLLSANALTCDGRIVNIDGNGNRVAASVSGPGKVVYAIGRNKIVDGVPPELHTPRKEYALRRNRQMRRLRLARPHMQGHRDLRSPSDRHADDSVRGECGSRLLRIA